jgi:rhodanese-related sulfurtransferase
MAYAGDLTPQQAYQLLQDDPQAVLVDVRTRAEWNYVGLPDLEPIGRTVGCVEWVTFPDGEPNPGFLDQLVELGVRPGVPVAFLCRSGVRSAAAAELATARGLGPAYNISDGFEGPPDASAHRGSTAGWKAAGLPWRQG